MKRIAATHFLTTALLAGVFAMPVLGLQEAGPGEAQQPAEQADVAVSVAGKLVIPEELPGSIKAEDIDLSKLSGSVLWMVPGRPNPYPEGFEEMTDDEKKAWAKAFQASPEFQEYRKQSQAWQLEQRKHQPSAVAFAADGSFRIDGLKPGSYFLRASIAHPKMARMPIASFQSPVEVKADGAQADLGDLTLEVYAVLLPGEVAPNFTAEYYDGNKFQLSDYRGKYVLLDFWATWCGPCIREMPNLKAVYEDFAGDQFEMISLSLDKSIDLPKKFHEDKPSPYVHGYLGEWNTTETATKAYGIRGIPSIWLIGPDGKIVARDLRGNALREAVRKAVQGD